MKLCQKLSGLGLLFLDTLYIIYVADCLYMDIMLMRDVESVKTSLLLSRFSRLRLCVRRLSLFACTLPFVAQLLCLLHHTVGLLQQLVLRFLLCVVSS